MSCTVAANRCCPNTVRGRRLLRRNRNSRQTVLGLPQHKSKNPLRSRKPQRSRPHLALRRSTIQKPSNPSASFGLFQTIALSAPIRSFLLWLSRISFGSPRKTVLTIPRLFSRGRWPVLPRREIRLPDLVRGPPALAGIIGTRSLIKPWETSSRKLSFQRLLARIRATTRWATAGSFAAPAMR